MNVKQLPVRTLAKNACDPAQIYTFHYVVMARICMSGGARAGELAFHHMGGVTREECNEG